MHRNCWSFESSAFSRVSNCRIRLAKSSNSTITTTSKTVRASATSITYIQICQKYGRRHSHKTPIPGTKLNANVGPSVVVKVATDARGSCWPNQVWCGSLSAWGTQRECSPLQPRTTPRCDGRLGPSPVVGGVAAVCVDEAVRRWYWRARI